MLSYLCKTNRIRRWGRTRGWEPRRKGWEDRKEQQVGVLRGRELGKREKRREIIKSDFL